MDPGHNRDRGWNIAISPRPSSVFPGIFAWRLSPERIDHPGPGALEMTRISRHHGEVVDDRRGGDAAIGDEAPGSLRESSPDGGDIDGNREDALRIRFQDPLSP